MIDRVGFADRVPLAPARTREPGPHGHALQTALLDAIAALGDAVRPLSPGVADLMRLRYVEGLPPPTVFRRRRRWGPATP